MPAWFQVASETCDWTELDRRKQKEPIICQDLLTDPLTDPLASQGEPWCRHRYR